MKETDSVALETSTASLISERSRSTFARRSFDGIRTLLQILDSDICMWWLLSIIVFRSLNFRVYLLNVSEVPKPGCTCWCLSIYSSIGSSNSLSVCVTSDEYTYADSFETCLKFSTAIKIQNQTLGSVNISLKSRVLRTLSSVNLDREPSSSSTAD